MTQDKARGRFVWYDLVSDDPEAAESFYTEVTGWAVARRPGRDDPSWIWTLDERPLAGVRRPAPDDPHGDAPAHWLAFVGTPDVDATAVRVRQLGGTVVSPPAAGADGGRFAVLADPQGAVFAALTAAGEPPGDDGPPRVGEFSWHELATRDHADAFAFYSELFGWRRLEAMDMGEMGTYQMYGRDGMPLGGMFDQPAEMPAPPHWLLYVRLADLDAALQRVRSAGGEVVNGPMEVPGGDRVARCTDPAGAAFALHQQASGG